MARTESGPRNAVRYGASGDRHVLAIVGFSAPFLILFSLFYIVPIGYAVVQSLIKVQRQSAYSPPTQVFAGIEQYVRVFQSGAFWEGVEHVLILLVTQVPVTIGLGLVFALLIDSSYVRGRRFFRLAFFVPYAVPGVVAAIMWSFFYAPTISPFPELARRLDLLEGPGLMFALANIIVWAVAGFNMLIMYSALQAIPPDLYEAAQIDGASNLRIAWSIKVPLILPAIIMTAVFSIIATLQLFNEPTVLKVLSKSMGTNFTPNMLVYATASTPNYNLAAAFSVVLAVSTCILSFFFLRLTQKRAFA